MSSLGQHHGAVVSNVAHIYLMMQEKIWYKSTNVCCIAVMALLFPLRGNTKLYYVKEIHHF